MANQTQAPRIGPILTRESQNDTESNSAQVFAVPGFLTEGRKEAIDWYLARGAAPGTGRRAGPEKGQ